jgi:hypothetical protein
VLTGEARGAQIFCGGGTAHGTDYRPAAVFNQSAMVRKDEIRELPGQFLIFDTIANQGAALFELTRRRGVELAQFVAQTEGLQKAGVGVCANDESGRNRKPVAQQFAEIGAFASDRVRIADAYFVQRQDERCHWFFLVDVIAFIVSSSP